MRNLSYQRTWKLSFVQIQQIERGYFWRLFSKVPVDCIPTTYTKVRFVETIYVQQLSRDREILNDIWIALVIPHTSQSGYHFYDNHLFNSFLPLLNDVFRIRPLSLRNVLLETNKNLYAACENNSIMYTPRQQSKVKEELLKCKMKM